MTESVANAPALSLEIFLVYAVLAAVMVISGVVNNTPVVMVLARRDFVTELFVAEESDLDGRTLGETDLFDRDDVQIVDVVREHEPVEARSDLVLEYGDRLTIRCNATNVLELRDMVGPSDRELHQQRRDRGALLAIGQAMETTGAAALLVSQLSGPASLFGPWLMLALVYALASLLTETITNNAVAVLLTPLGYQTNTIVYGAGNYRFKDFLRIGLPLNVLAGVVAVLLIPYFWPLQD